MPARPQCLAAAGAGRLHLTIRGWPKPCQLVHRWSTRSSRCSGRA